MNAEPRERASELARGHELDINKYTAKAIRDLLAEVERLEEELKTQKQAAWNHERVSRDYLLAMKKVKNQDEQIVALTRQRDTLAEGLIRIKQMCQPNTLYHEVAIKTLADAGMEIK